ncbi:MAG: glucose-6-phosphate isomerase, partial [Gallionella sp.]|nr:glucose-6-phosphate isomerase [Gallionella sp.]
MSKLTQSTAWKALSVHYTTIQPQRMRQMFQDDPARFDKFSIKLGSLLFDYSKNRITEETRQLLIDLANQAEIPAYIERMFAGEKINLTEHRAVLHTALRNRS